MAFYGNQSNIIRAPYVLSPSYVPDSFVGRAEQLLALHSCVAPVLRNHRPFNAWLCGPSGSGKTSAVKYVLATIARQRPFKWLYVNCWDRFTLYSVLDAIAAELRLLGAEMQSTAAKLRKIAVALASQPAIIVLDEVDHVHPADRNAIIYNLLELTNVGLVCLAYRRHAIAELDSRVRSRLNPVVIHFPGYEEQEMLELLRSRTGEALFPCTCDDTILRQIAKLADGDARIAIESLRFAAFAAERQGALAVGTEHLAGVRAKADAVRELELWAPLNVHHRNIYEIVRREPGIQSGSLRDSYIGECHDKKLTALAHRTFLDYVATMVRLGLLKEERVIGQGKARCFHVVDATEGKKRQGLI